MRRVPALLALVLLLPACKSDHKPPVDPDAAQRAARARLAQLAGMTANATYDATYRFVQVGSNASGTVRIFQRLPQYRIDIKTKNLASFFSLKAGIVSCSQKGSKRACFLVARPGEDPPALFDPGVQRLFRDAVEDLSAHPDDYVVNVLPSPTASSATPEPAPALAGECFLVNRVSPTASSAPKRVGFENGTYCFAPTGIATRIDVLSGSLTLTAVGPAPDASRFKPFAHVTTLPSLTSPTPKK